MRTLSQAFNDHFKNTPAEQIKAEWERAKSQNKCGPSVDVFFEMIDYLNECNSLYCQFEEYEDMNMSLVNTSGSFFLTPN